MNKPKNYYCHRNNNIETFKNKQFKVLGKIGEGAFGEVYKVFNEESSNIEVIKRTKEDDNQLMMKQAQIMSQLQNSDGFAKIKSKNANQGYFIMTLLGQNIQEISDKSKFNIIDIKRIAFQCIKRLEQLHQKGYVHRDIKPQNILMGNQTHPHKIYLVDFGLSTTFRRNAKAARLMYDGQIGTVKYCSIAAHNGREQFPKDDLQSLGYSLIYLATKSLPWSFLNPQMQVKQKYAEIKRMKQQKQFDKLCQGISCLKKYMKMVINLTLDQTISYQNLLQIFKLQCKQNYCFSFCNQTCFAKLLSKKQQILEEDDGNEEQEQNGHLNLLYNKRQNLLVFGNKSFSNKKQFL